MRKLRLLSLLLAAAMLAGVIGTAAADDQLSTLVDYIDCLLTFTDNVTVKGSAEFTLDGERFKNVDVTYIQDGENSYWDLKTLTPKADGTEREGGYTIIANGEDIYVMEVFYPGYFKSGTDDAQSTLVRETSLLSPMLSFVRILADEVSLPMTVTKNGSDTVYRIALKNEDVPLWLDAAANVAARYLSGRFFGTGLDTSTEYMKYNSWESYNTVTQALVNTTEYINLDDFDVTFVMDDQPDITGISGYVQITAADVWGRQRIVKATFNLEIGDYGSSHVDAFDAAEYGVVPFVEYRGSDYREWEDESDEIDPAFIDTAYAIAEAMGFSLSEDSETIAWHGEGYIMIHLYDEEQDLRFDLVHDRTAAAAWNLNNPVLLWDADVEPITGVSEDVLAEALQVLKAFTEKANPTAAEVAVEVNPVGMVLDGDGTLYLYFEDGTHTVFWILKAGPEWTVEGFRMESQG